jgi:hypothetical protein
MSVVAVETLYGTSLSTLDKPQTTVIESLITFHLRTAQVQHTQSTESRTRGLKLTLISTRSAVVVAQDSGRTQTVSIHRWK